MSRGYWAGLIMGGLLGITISRFYGDKLQSVFSNTTNFGTDASPLDEEKIYRPGRRGRIHPRQR